MNELILFASNYFTKGVVAKICDSPQKARMEKIEFYIVAFEPSKIQTHSALENNYLNLFFFEKISCNLQKITTYSRIVVKWPFKREIFFLDIIV